MKVADFITQAHEHQKGKVCKKCKEYKSLSEFNKDKVNKDGFRYECKACAAIYHSNTCRFKRWFGSKRARCKAAGTEFTIEPTDIPGVKIRKYKNYQNRWSWEAIKYPKVCSVFSVELDWDAHICNNNSPSLDRVNPTKGYVPGNVMLISNKANRMKQNMYLKELKIFEEYILLHQHVYSNHNQLELFGE
jgi:hypothetical protein